jgi:acetyl esterase/lipase
MAAHAGALAIDPGRLAIYGGSAGGGLAISTALRVRDEGGPALRYVMAPYPMIDDRPHLAAGDLMASSWESYLGGRAADRYAAPAREVDLSGLPATFIDVGDQDLFMQETVDFATRLLNAGVTAELHVYPGADHASEIFEPSSDLSRQIWRTRFAALERALA